MRNRLNIRSMAESEQGESLVETVVAFLVITIALLAFATMVAFGFGLTSQAEVLDSVNTSFSAGSTIHYSNTNYNMSYSGGN